MLIVRGVIWKDVTQRLQIAFTYVLAKHICASTTDVYGIDGSQLTELRRSRKIQSTNISNELYPVQWQLYRLITCSSISSVAP